MMTTSGPRTLAVIKQFITVFNKDKVMLRIIKQLYGEKLGTSEGDIGHVKDFYFDDQKWAVRYVVVETGSWLSARLVLISPHAFGDLHRDGKVLLVNLTRKQIENSPSIETHKPVSRQYEEEYCRSYRWSSSWLGDAMWGMSGFPVISLPPCPLPSTQAIVSGSPRYGYDPHLRSTHAVSGYHIQPSDGMIGHVTDFTMDEKSWAIRHLVVETGHWFSGKEVLISLSKIDRISYLESKVFVNLTKEAIRKAPEYYVFPVDAEDHHIWDFRDRIVRAKHLRKTSFVLPRLDVSKKTNSQATNE
jgi:sporulation protein YlmC with PRC-barrel domain